MKTQVEIISATECRTLNPYNPRPYDPENPKGQTLHTPDFIIWQQAENERKIYKFKIKYLGVLLTVEELKQINSTFLLDDYYIGSIHEAEPNNETMEAIIL